MCGSQKVDGFAFCIGIQPVNNSFTYQSDLQSLIRSVIYLIKDAVFRPEYSMSRSGRSTLNISPLSVLVDMYHAHDATKCHDKVFALLGMSTDDLSNSKLSPNYGITWEDLLQRLTRHVLSREVTVDTWKEDQAAVIKSKGCILGRVISIEDISVRGSQHCVTLEVSPLDFKIEIGGLQIYRTQWTIQATATSVQDGDLICLLQGASEPSIIRLQQDYFILVVVAINFPEEREKKRDIGWPTASLFSSRPSRNFLIVWDWDKLPMRSLDLRQYETWIRTRGWGFRQSNVETEGHLAQATRTWNVVLILGDLAASPGVYGMFRSQIKLQMEERGREAVMDFEIAIKDRGSYAPEVAEIGCH
jgi:hypothetical protein